MRRLFTPLVLLFFIAVSACGDSETSSTAAVASDASQGDLTGEVSASIDGDSTADSSASFAPLAAIAVAPVLGGGHGKMDNGITVLGVPDFRVAAEVAHQDHLIDAACHTEPPLSSECQSRAL